MDLHQKVALGTAAAAHRALARHTDGLAVVHTGRDLDGDFFVLPDLGLAPAGGAGIFDRLSRTAAFGAGGLLLHGAEGGLPHGAGDAGAAAGCAGLRSAAVGGAGAVTLGALLDAGGGDLLFAAEGRFLKGQRHSGADIFALPGTISPGGAGAAAAEEIVENAAQVHVEPAKAAAETAEAAVRGKIGIDPRKAVLVVPGTLVGVGQDLVGLADLLKTGLGLLVAGM